MILERIREAAVAGILAIGLLCLFASSSAAATVPNNFTDVQVVSDLDMPSGFAFLPDGRILVVEQWSAQVRLIVNGAIGSTDPLVTVPNVVNDHGERGLLGMEVDSDWPNRPYIYVYYNQSGGTCYLSMYTVTGDLSDPNSDNLQINPSSRYDLITDIPDFFANQNGGGVRFGNDDMLYVSIGDDVDECECQETSSLYGVILRLDMSAMPGSGSGPPPKADITPSDNPFSGDEITDMVWCYGLRNAFRFDFDPVTGDMIIGDVGEVNNEEMNIATGGENFGWPFREGDLIRTPAGCDEPGGPGGTDYDDPIYFYDRVGMGSASIIGAGMYRPVDYPNDSSFPPEYNGDIFFCEYYQGFMVRLKNNGSSWEVADPVDGQPNDDHWATDISEVSDMQVGPDGAIWYLDQFDPAWPDLGGLRRISYDGPSQPEPRIITGPGPEELNDCQVRVWNPQSTGVALAEWSAYGVPKFGVNVATGDLDNDGLAEVITGAGPGAVFGPHVRGFDLMGTAVPGVSFLAYGTNKYGVNVAAGDLDDDGYDEIVTGAGPGAVFGPHVRGWNVDGGAPTAISGISYFAYGTPKWGVNVACGDIDGDGYDEIVSGAGPGAVYGPHIRGWNYDGGPSASSIPQINYFAYGTLKFGVNVACGDFDGDGIDEIVSGAGPGVVFGSHVRGWNYDGDTLAAVGGINFFAYPDSLYGVRAALVDLDDDGFDELLTVPGPAPDWPTQVKAWNVDGGTATAIGSIDFDAYADGGFMYGGSVAGGIGY